MAKLLIGYDVEGSRFKEIGESVTEKFLTRMQKVHSELNAPCTLFVLGQTLELNISSFKKLREEKIFDVQQHTYSHISLKTLLQENSKGVRFVPGATIAEIRSDVDRASRGLKKYLEIDCLGLTGPNMHYRGLSDRPDILKVLHEIGIRFVRTYGRNEKDYQPVSLDIQPFWYEVQGFPDMLEIPVQGWQDWLWREEHGWEKTGEFLDYLKSRVDYIVKKDLTWGLMMHDVTCLREDPEMSVVRRFLEYAQKQGVELNCCKDFYEMECAKRAR